MRRQDQAWTEHLHVVETTDGWGNEGSPHCSDGMKEQVIYKIHHESKTVSKTILSDSLEVSISRQTQTGVNKHNLDGRVQHFNSQKKANHIT